MIKRGVLQFVFGTRHILEFSLWDGYCHTPRHPTCEVCLSLEPIWLMLTDAAPESLLLHDWMQAISSILLFLPAFVLEGGRGCELRRGTQLQTVAIWGEKGALHPCLCSRTAASNMKGRRLESWILHLFLAGFIQSNLGQAESQKVRHYSVVQGERVPENIVSDSTQQRYCNSTTYTIE